MSTTTIRQKIHNYLAVANDKKIKAIYAIMEHDIEETAIEYTAEMKKELDNRYTAYKNGTAKLVTAAESKKRIQKILNAARKK